MSKGVNLSVLLGNVGSEPEVRTTGSGTKVAKMSLATNDGWGDKEKTNWHRVVAFGKLADVVEQHVHKGDRLHVIGRIDYSQTTDDKGNTKYWTDIIADNITFAGGGQKDGPVEAMARNPFAQDDPSLKPLPF